MVKFIGIVVLICLVVALLGTGVVRYELVTIQKPFWLILLGIILTAGGAIVVACDLPIGGLFVTAGLISMALGGYKAMWPNTSEASTHAQSVADNEGASALNALVAPRRIPCDKTTQPRPEFFDQVTGKAKIWVAVDALTGQYECYNRPGFHAVTQEQLIAADARLALIILAQEPLATPTPPAPPKPTPIYISTPLPELGEGPIPPEWLSAATPTPTPELR